MNTFLFFALILFKLRIWSFFSCFLVKNDFVDKYDMLLFRKMSYWNMENIVQKCLKLRFMWVKVVVFCIVFIFWVCANKTLILQCTLTTYYLILFGCFYFCMCIFWQIISTDHYGSFGGFTVNLAYYNYLSWYTFFPLNYALQIDYLSKSDPKFKDSLEVLFLLQLI